MKMKGQNRMVTAITSLIRKTQDGVMKWRQSSPPDDLLIPKAETVVETVYFTKADDRVVRLYTYRGKYYYDYMESLPEKQEVGLEVSDESGTSWWRFPDIPAIWDLVDAVRFKTAGVEQFLEKLGSE